MNETTETLDHNMDAAADLHGHDVDGHDDGHHDHPSDWEYVKIALILGVFTLIEVGTYFESVHNLPEWALYASLTFLMVVKFVMVGWYFMHLKQDSKVYTWMFGAGLVLALAVYFIFLFASSLFG